MRLSGREENNITLFTGVFFLEIFMANILCHGHSQKAEVFLVKPTLEIAEKEEVLYLKECNICRNPVLEIHRIDVYGESLEPIRIKTKNIDNFLSKMIVLEKEKKQKRLKNSNPTWV